MNEMLYRPLLGPIAQLIKPARRDHFGSSARRHQQDSGAGRAQRWLCSAG